MAILFNVNLIVVLRLLHIVAGALWVGASVAYAIVFIPALNSSESAGQAVMKRLGPKFHKFMAIMANITILAGVVLYSRYFIGTGIRWIWSSGVSIAFSLGAVAGILSFIMGGAFFAPTQKKIEMLERDMQASERPSAEQLARMDALQTTMLKAGQIDVWLMLFALGAMAIARYL
jgi:hypothetical protein